MRSKIVAGNWKMNNNQLQTETLISELKSKIEASETEVMIAPTFVNLNTAIKSCVGSSIEVIAQNMHFADNGAYTGEISGEMLKSIGVETVILGHSERRAYFNETDESLAKKVDQALKLGLRIIFCFGEELQDRKSANQEQVVKSQLQNALFHLDDSVFNNIVLAYEPVWAIGTGETATPEQAQDMHAFIRSLFRERYNDQVANTLSILYGGSVKPNNAKDIFSKPDVDGGLIGGASLKAEDFSAIISSI